MRRQKLKIIFGVFSLIWPSQNIWGAVTPSLSASRVTGVAPLSVFFDATGTTSSSSSRPFHELEYSWDFNDASSGQWPDGRSRNSAKGGVSAHVFENPGSYTVSLVVRSGDGESANTQVVITVQDPDVVFSPPQGETFVFSTGSDFSGAPPGATQITTSNFETIMSYVGTGRRILLRRGDQWTTSANHTFVVPGPGIIGAFGTCNAPDERGMCANAPVIDATSYNNNNNQNSLSVFSFEGYSGVNNVSEWRLMDLKLVGGVNPSAGIGINGISGFSHSLIYRVNVHGFYTGMGTGLWVRANDQTSIVDSEVGFSYSNQVYVGANRLALMGNYFHDSYDSHVLRVWQSGKGVIEHNTLERASIVNTVNGRHALKFHGPSDAEVAQFSNLTRSQYTVVSDNIIGNSGPWPVTIGPQDTFSNEVMSNIVFERNYFRSNAMGRLPVFSLHISARDVTVRNNIFNASDAGRDYTSINVLRRQLEPAPDNVQIYNNLTYRSDNVANNGTPFSLVSIEPEATRTMVMNNVISAPNLPANFPQQVTIGAGTSVNSNNLISANPLFVVSPPLFPSDFRVTTGSPLIDAGTVVAGVQDDFDGLHRPQGAEYDIGPYEFGNNVNNRPTVNAGPDQTLESPANTATLAGTVADDGLPNPPGQTTANWARISGPGNVTFGNTSALSTSATFSQPGTYVLRLTANDGALSSSDDVQIVMNRESGSGSGGAANNNRIITETRIVPCSNPQDSAERSRIPVCFDVKESGNVSITIYSRQGKKVRELLNGHRDAGENRMDWDLKDDAGNPISSGGYTVIFESGGIRNKGKLAVIK